MPPTDALAPDYASARARFLAGAARVGAVVEHHVNPERGPADEELAIDTAWIGPPDAPAVVLVVSGTHGVEGFGGSLCQSRLLEGHEPDDLPDGVALLLVHAFNPFGFAWVRRVNEQNVDLNRNFVDFGAPPPNAGYDELADAIAPDEWSDEVQEATSARILEYAEAHGLDATQEAVSRGQYRHPDGLYYGGDRPAWSHEVLRGVVEQALTNAARVAVLDLHTGLGRFGALELITHEPRGTAAYDRSVLWWGDRVASSASGDSVSADLVGEWIPAVQAWLAPAEVTGVALEWGTVDVLHVLQGLRADNWLHTRGDPRGPEASAIKAQLRAAFAPDDPAWIDDIWPSFVEVLDATLAALRDIA